MPRVTHLSIAPEAPFPEVKAPFFQIPSDMATKAIRLKLTGSDWAVWAYLQMLDPHGDRYTDLPEPSVIAESIGISERQFYRSLERLADNGFYEYKVIAIKGRNIAGHRAKQSRQKADKDVREMTKMPPADKDVREMTKMPPADKDVREMTKMSDAHNNDRAHDQTIQTIQIAPHTFRSEPGVGVNAAIAPKKEVEPRPLYRSSVEKSDDLFKPVPQWRRSNRQNDYTPEFVSFVHARLNNLPCNKGKKVPIADAKTWIATREFNEQGVLEILIQVEAWQEKGAIASTSPASHDWNTDPRRQTWLEEFNRTSKNAFLLNGHTHVVDEDRYAFFQHALKEGWIS